MIRAGVIGLGNMGRHHARAYSQIPEATLVAVCDMDSERLAACHREPDTVAYTTVDDMLEQANLDVVNICLPTRYHYDVAKRCLARGIHTLIEKPITQTVAQANDLIALAQDRGVWLTVGHIERFNPAIDCVTTAIRSGQLGRIQSIICQRYGPFPPQITDSDVLVDVAVHDIDIAAHIIQGPIVSQRVHTQSIHARDRADFGHIHLVFEPDVSVTIVVSWAVPFKKRCMEIIGSKGVAYVDCLTQTVTLWPVEASVTAGGVIMPIQESVTLPVLPGEPIVLECQAFIASVQHNRPPVVSPVAATQALAVALMGREGA
jgi:UDP-N-acetylglucosamine 3-dehydrogenase